MSATLIPLEIQFFLKLHLIINNWKFFLSLYQDCEFLLPEKYSATFKSSYDELKEEKTIIFPLTLSYGKMLE